MTPPVRIRCGGKINLSLRIGPRRPDGMHDVDTLFFPVAEPFDELVVSPAEPGAGILFSCSDAALGGTDNLVVRAYKSFAKATCNAPDVRVHLEKNIPTGAGLGGGSSDAAGLLLWLNAQAGVYALPVKTLIALAARLGADTPFFLVNEPSRGTGIGDALSPVDVDLSGLTLVLVVPPVFVSTAWAYKALDQARDGLTSAAGPPKSPGFPEGRLLENDFESVVFAAHPEIAALKSAFYRAGAAAALLSGSGASVFGFFREREAAEDFAQKRRGCDDRVFVQTM